MTIKIKFSQNDLKRRAAKLLELDPREIWSVCPTEGGTKFFVEYLKCGWGGKSTTITFSIWQIVDVIPLADISGSVENFWEKGYETVLFILGLKEMPKSEDEIKRAYRKLAKTHHPDMGGDVNNFRQIHYAYESLVNALPELRCKVETYDPMPDFED
jgi:hypothetical protein